MESLLLSPESLKESAAKRDIARLQGTWNYVSGIRQAQLLISGDHYTVKFKKSGDIYVGTFQVDPTLRPKAMDMVIHEGPERHRGKTSLCIYEFDGPYLIWCPSPPGATERRIAFPPESDLEHLCLVLKHEKVTHAPQGAPHLV
jgi:uncharacterized protein (TIGR03067 family)